MDTPSCSEPWTTIFLTQNGDVKTCCNSERIFGNVTKESIQKLWNNEKYKAYREAIINKKVPAECEKCVEDHRETNMIPIIEAQFSDEVISAGDTCINDLKVAIRDKDAQINSLEAVIKKLEGECLFPHNIGENGKNSPSRIVDDALMEILLDIPTDEGFMNECYIKILSREPDPNGLHAHLAKLKKGKNRISVINSLAHSPEALSKGVVYKSSHNLSFTEKAKVFLKRMPFISYFANTMNS